MTSSAQRAFRCITTGLLALLSSLPAEAACNVPDWNPVEPVQAPTQAPGTRWVFTGGADFPPTQLRLIDTKEGVTINKVNDVVELREKNSTYTEVNPSRDGEQVWIHFPVAIGDRWQDDFREVGEYHSQYEHYFYDYHETSSSQVVGVEEITVAAGTFKALRIDRIAYWTKDHPQTAEDSRFSRTSSAERPAVSGVTLTQLWYVPPVGRVVLKAQMRIGDGYYANLVSELLEHRNAAVIELRQYEQGPIHCDDVPVRLAVQPEMYMPLGFPAQQNDSWEWAFQMRNHYPRRSPR